MSSCLRRSDASANISGAEHSYGVTSSVGAWPLLLLPQQAIVPSARSEQLCSPPASSER